VLSTSAEPTIHFRALRLLESKRFPLAVFIVGFLARLIARLLQGPNTFWETGYHAYSRLVTNIVSHGDYTVATNFGNKRAFWPPIYPLFLALFTVGNRWYIPAIIAQSAIGALTAVIIYYLGCDLFSRQTAAIAGIITALYPYYVLHDGKVQDTVLFTFMMALCIFLLSKCWKNDSDLLWAAAGLVLGLALLTRAMLQPFALMVFLWLAFTRGRRVLLTIAVFLLTISPWLIRNYVELGSPVFTTQTGRFVWDAHNDDTFVYYPAVGIDNVEWNAWKKLPYEEQARIQAMDEISQSAYFEAKGVDYIKAHPARTLYQSLLKVKTAFSWMLSPSDNWTKQIIYFISYFPVFILGLWGMFRSRNRWRELVPIYALFIGFVLITTFFWSHTSHRTVLDCYLIMFSAYAIYTIVGR
jgi:4-amino-4-deoxy-L-arabinose transferase-like glycosyltransferase